MWLVRLLPVALVACIPVLTSPPGDDGDGGPWIAPDNSWGLCAEGPPEGFVGEGYGVGDVAPD
jgi:hypothetical protein